MAAAATHEDMTAIVHAMRNHHGVRNLIENYFQGGHSVIDILQTNDGAFNLPALIPPMVA